MKKVCTHCGHSKDESEFHKGKNLCKECRRIEGGITAFKPAAPCKICGGPGYAKGYCEEHYRSSPEYLQRHYASRKRTKKEREEAGVCIECGFREPYNGLTCKVCKAIIKARSAKSNPGTLKRRQERIAAGLCPRCDSPLAPGRKLCQYHLDLAKAASKRHYEMKQEKARADAAWERFKETTDGIAFANWGNTNIAKPGNNYRNRGK